MSKCGTAPAISVVMSVYNGVKYLRKGMEGLLNQTFRDFEISIMICSAGW